MTEFEFCHRAWEEDRKEERDEKKGVDVRKNQAKRVWMKLSLSKAAACMDALVLSSGTSGVRCLRWPLQATSCAGS